MCLTLLFLTDHLLGLQGVLVVPCGVVFAACVSLGLIGWIGRALQRNGAARGRARVAAGSPEVEEIRSWKEGGRVSATTGQWGLASTADCKDEDCASGRVFAEQVKADAGGKVQHVFAAPSHYSVQDVRGTAEMWIAADLSGRANMVEHLGVAQKDTISEEFLVGPGRPPRTTPLPSSVGRGSDGDAGSGDTASNGEDREDHGNRDGGRPAKRENDGQGDCGADSANEFPHWGRVSTTTVGTAVQEAHLPEYHQSLVGLLSRNGQCRAGGGSWLGSDQISSNMASSGGRGCAAYESSDEQRRADTGGATGGKGRERDSWTARVCELSESCLSLRRIAHALEDASLQRRLEQCSHDSGSLTQLTGVCRWAVFVARGCDTYDVKWCKGLLGLELYYGLRRAGAAPSMCADFAGLRTPITNRLAFGAAAGHWGSRRSARSNGCTLTAADFSPWVDCALDEYLQPEDDKLESPPPENLEEWERQTANQIRVFAWLYGAEHAAERSRARDLLLHWHDRNSEEYPMEDIAKWWEELWWYWWQVVQDVVHIALPTEYCLSVDAEIVRKRVFTMQQDGKDAQMRLAGVFNLTEVDGYFCKVIRGRRERFMDRHLWNLVWQRRQEDAPCRDGRVSNHRAGEDCESSHIDEAHGGRNTEQELDGPGHHVYQEPEPQPASEIRTPGQRSRRKALKTTQKASEQRWPSEGTVMSTAKLGNTYWSCDDQLGEGKCFRKLARKREEVLDYLDPGSELQLTTDDAWEVCAALGIPAGSCEDHQGTLLATVAAVLWAKTGERPNLQQINSEAVVARAELGRKADVEHKGLWRPGCHKVPLAVKSVLQDVHDAVHAHHHRAPESFVTFPLDVLQGVNLCCWRVDPQGRLSETVLTDPGCEDAVTARVLVVRDRVVALAPKTVEGHCPTPVAGSVEVERLGLECLDHEETPGEPLYDPTEKRCRDCEANVARKLCNRAGDTSGTGDDPDEGNEDTTGTGHDPDEGDKVITNEETNRASSLGPGRGRNDATARVCRLTDDPSSKDRRANSDPVMEAWAARVRQFGYNHCRDFVARDAAAESSAENPLPRDRESGTEDCSDDERGLCSAPASDQAKDSEGSALSTSGAEQLVTLRGCSSQQHEADDACVARVCHQAENPSPGEKSLQERLELPAGPYGRISLDGRVSDEEEEEADTDPWRSDGDPRRHKDEFIHAYVFHRLNPSGRYLHAYAMAPVSQGGQAPPTLPRTQEFRAREWSSWLTDEDEDDKPFRQGGDCVVLRCRVCHPSQNPQSESEDSDVEDSSLDSAPCYEGANNVSLEEDQEDNESGPGLPDLQEDLGPYIEMSTDGRVSFCSALKASCPAMRFDLENYGELLPLETGRGRQLAERLGVPAVGYESSQCVSLAITAAAEWAMAGRAPPASWVKRVATEMRCDMCAQAQECLQFMGEPAALVSACEDDLRSAVHDCIHPHHPKSQDVVRMFHPALLKHVVVHVWIENEKGHIEEVITYPSQHGTRLQMEEGIDNVAAEASSRTQDKSSMSQVMS